MIATFIKPNQIQKNFLKEYNISISVTTIAHYANHDNYQKTIARIREKWGNDILKIELSHKRRRLEEITKIYEEARTDKDHKVALNALYQIQHEVEKDLANINQQNNYQVNIYKDMSESELEEERLKSFERLKILKNEISKPVKEIENVKE